MNAAIDLRAARLNRGLSLAAMASQIGVTKKVLGDAERGATPQPANALKIASFHGLTVTQMWPSLLEDEAA